MRKGDNNFCAWKSICYKLIRKRVFILELFFWGPFHKTAYGQGVQSREQTKLRFIYDGLEVGLKSTSTFEQAQTQSVYSYKVSVCFKETTTRFWCGANAHFPTAVVSIAVYCLPLFLAPFPSDIFFMFQPLLDICSGDFWLFSFLFYFRRGGQGIIKYKYAISVCFCFFKKSNINYHKELNVNKHDVL